MPKDQLVTTESDVLAELITSPISTLEEVILNPNSSVCDLEYTLSILEDIITQSTSLSNTIIQRINRLRYKQQVINKDLSIFNMGYYPVFYSKEEISAINKNKYMMEKFWGLPFMCQREKWPKDKDEEFLKFFGQIIDPRETEKKLYRIFINFEKNTYTVMPIILTEYNISKWLKGTYTAFKNIPHNPNEYLIKEWVPYKEIKRYQEIKEYISEEDYDIIINTSSIDNLTGIKIGGTYNCLNFEQSNHLLQFEENSIFKHHIEFANLVNSADRSNSADRPNSGIYHLFKDEKLYFDCCIYL